jgi:hypothetical protein
LNHLGCEHAYFLLCCSVLSFLADPLGRYSPVLGRVLETILGAYRAIGGRD